MESRHQEVVDTVMAEFMTAFLQQFGGPRQLADAERSGQSDAQHGLSTSGSQGSAHRQKDQRQSDGRP